MIGKYEEEMMTGIEPVVNAYNNHPERSGREPSCALTTIKSPVLPVPPQEWIFELRQHHRSDISPLLPLFLQE
jgi:hypothetical protein